MPKTEKGNRIAKLPVRIVEEGNKITMFFDDYNVGPITFKSATGSSGPKAHQKLTKILDAEAAKKVAG
jgi:hypothetical protein